MEEQQQRQNPLERDHQLTVVLPGGLEKDATVHGSKPVMDLLVTLCASYHLNPSDYAVEVLSPSRSGVSVKPNSPVGSLEAEKIVLKPKGMEEKIKRPYMPEATVRLLINYNKSHKAVVRVSPRVPLELLLPVVCDKCEFDVQTTVLLRDCQSEEPLDVSKTLNEMGLREVFARDTAAEHLHQPRTPEAEVISPPPPQDLPRTKPKQKENAGFLSLFRRRKKKPGTDEPASAPASPGITDQSSGALRESDVSSCNTPPADVPKKRRAPPPPMGASQSVPNSLGGCHLAGAQRSGESTLKRTKRRAPPPPCVSPQQRLQADTPAAGTPDSLSALEELDESDASGSVHLSLSSSSSPRPSQPHSTSSSSRPSLAHLHAMVDSCVPTFHGKDLFDARHALAKVLTSSIANGALVRRLRNSASFPKSRQRSSFSEERSPDDGMGSILDSNLPTEPEWEDPCQRGNMTTFKVVPSIITRSQDPEQNLASPETEITANQEETKAEVEPCSSDTYETQSPLPGPDLWSAEAAPASPQTPPDSDGLDCPGSPDNNGKPEEVVVVVEEEEEEEEVPSEVTPAAPSHCTDQEVTVDGQINAEDASTSPQGSSPETFNVDHVGSCTEEDEAEDAAPPEEDEEHLFPPPPPPIYYHEGGEILEVGDEDVAGSPQPTSSGPADALSEDPQDEPERSSATRDNVSGTRDNVSGTRDNVSATPDNVSATPSRFAQAVALAVQRSRLQGRPKGLSAGSPSGPNGPLLSPPRSVYQYGA